MKGYHDQRRSVVVTTSWDDGHRLDNRLAELLDKYQLPGTFYISPHARLFAERDRLSSSEIAAISARFEIGAHTLTHPRLTSVTEAVARKEIVGSASYLEDVTSQPIKSFCYPYGAFRDEHVRIVRDAGFSYARTVQRFVPNAGTDSLRTPTTVHTYCHLRDILPALKYANLNPVMASDLYLHWDRLAMRLFDRVLESGGVFHLWGHSWEVDRRNDWEALGRVLEYISARPDVKYAVNSAVSEAGDGAAE